MNILDRYIGKTIIEATLLALLVLVGMQTFILFVGELHDIGTKNYGLAQALLYVPLQLPSNIYEFFPMAGLIGCLVGLGRLASGSELIVMRTAGISIAKVIWAVLKAGGLMLLVITLIGEGLGPREQMKAEAHKVLAMNGGQISDMQEGVWVRDGNNFIHIGQVLSGGQLKDITRYQFADDHRLLLASNAVTGFFHKGQWLFQNVQESALSKNHVTSQKYAQQNWHVTFNPRLLNLSVVDPNEQSLSKLYHYVQYLKQTNQSSNQAEFTLWKRIFQPLATLIMICLGVPFIFGPLRSATMGLRILAGIIVGFGFYMLNEFFGPLSMVYQLPPLLAAALPAILFALAGGILLWFAW